MPDPTAQGGTTQLARLRKALLNVSVHSAHNLGADRELLSALLDRCGEIARDALNHAGRRPMPDKSKPWWWPVLTDAAYCARLRDDYPEDAELSDEELVERYANGRKYAVTWDHIGDAYEEYEQLADAFLAKLKEAPVIRQPTWQEWVLIRDLARALRRQAVPRATPYYRIDINRD